jgi:hypothetical protein
MLKFMAHRGLFVATVGIPLAKCNNGNNNNNNIEQTVTQPYVSVAGSGLTGMSGV